MNRTLAALTLVAAVLIAWQAVPSPAAADDAAGSDVCRVHDPCGTTDTTTRPKPPKGGEPSTTTKVGETTTTTQKPPTVSSTVTTGTSPPSSSTPTTPVPSSSVPSTSLPSTTSSTLPPVAGGSLEFACWGTDQMRVEVHMPVGHRSWGSVKRVDPDGTPIAKLALFDFGEIDDAPHVMYIDVADGWLVKGEAAEGVATDDGVVLLTAHVVGPFEVDCGTLPATGLGGDSGARGPLSWALMLLGLGGLFALKAHEQKGTV